MDSIAPSLYRINDGFFCYGEATVFDNLHLSLEEGYFYGLIGPNGSGKSTLLDILMGILPLHSGAIEFRGKPLHRYPKREFARQVALVPQNVVVGFDFSVHDIVLMGRHPHIPRFSQPSQNDLEIVNRAIELLDITHLRDRLVTQLSGGEKQRVVVARAFAQNTDVIILDEATSNLDIEHTLGIMEVLSAMVRNSQKTVIAAIHDLNLAAAFCDKLIVLKEENVKYIGNVRSVLTPQLIQQVFSVNADIIYENNRVKVEFEMRRP